MRGIDLLASSCPDPSTSPPPAESTPVTFTEEQLNQIADRVISKLQQPAPDPAPADPENTPDPADPDPDNTGGETE